MKLSHGNNCKMRQKFAMEAFSIHKSKQVEVGEGGQQITEQVNAQQDGPATNDYIMNSTAQPHGLCTLDSQ